MNRPSAKTLSLRCHGSGYLICRCMGDGCCCDFHGSVECPGCTDCEWTDEELEEYWLAQEEIYGREDAE